MNEQQLPLMTKVWMFVLTFVFVLSVTRLVLGLVTIEGLQRGPIAAGIVMALLAVLHGPVVTPAPVDIVDRRS